MRSRFGGNWVAVARGLYMPFFHVMTSSLWVLLAPEVSAACGASQRIRKTVLDILYVHVI